MKKTLCSIAIAAILLFHAIADMMFFVYLIPDRFLGMIEGFAMFFGIAVFTIGASFIFCKLLVISLKGIE